MSISSFLVSMRAVCRVTPLLLALSLACAPSGLEKYSVDQPFDPESVLSLPRFRDTEHNLSERYLILTHLPENTCPSCQDRELRYLRSMEDRLGDSAGFAIIMAGHTRRDVRALNKIGILPELVFLIDDAHLHGLCPAFCINLIDLESRKIILRYNPRIETEGETERFEKAAIKLIAE